MRNFGKQLFKKKQPMRLCKSEVAFFMLVATFAYAPTLLFAESNIALIIGNNDYQDAPLSNPINDARAVGQQLQQIGYQTEVLINADRFEIEKALDEFSIAGKTATNAIFYFAGHGIQVDGENYLIPIGTIPENKRDLRKLLSLKEIISEIGHAEELGLVLLDSCRNNPFAAELAEVTGRGVAARGLSRVQRVEGNTLVAYATEADAIARDGDGKDHSPFTEALLRYVATPQMDVRRILGKVRDDVIESTNGAQKPYVYGSLGGDEYFINSNSTLNAQPVIQKNIADTALPPDLLESLTKFEQAIESKNLNNVLSNVTVSSYNQQYLEYLFQEFEIINISIDAFSSLENGKTYQGSLTIDSLVRENGDLATPTEALRSMKVTAESSGSDNHELYWR